MTLCYECVFVCRMRLLFWRTSYEMLYFLTHLVLLYNTTRRFKFGASYANYFNAKKFSADNFLFVAKIFVFGKFEVITQKIFAGCFFLLIFGLYAFLGKSCVCISKFVV